MERPELQDLLDEIANCCDCSDETTHTLGLTCDNYWRDKLQQIKKSNH